MISEHMKQRIEEMPGAQLIDWICLYCVDVRSTHSDDDAQEFINDIRKALEMRLNATAQPVSDGCKVPEGWKLVPIEPTEEMMRQGFEELSESKDPELGICLSSVYRRILAAAPGVQDD